VARDIILSVLDQSPIRRGGTPAQALRETVALAEACDRLGYRRYWLAEHHNSAGLASASPEILIGQVAAATRQIRVGSGGVMLSHYSPLKVAEQFRMLEALYPGRIDLGVGRAPGSDGLTAAALAHGPGRLPIDYFPEQLGELYGFLSGTLPDKHPFHAVRAMPAGETLPELWLLGSSTAGGSYAAALGWAFSFAHFISPDGGEDVVREYKRLFKPSPFLDAPRASLGVSVTCAETTAEAERLSWSRWGWRLMSTPGRAQYTTGGGIPSPDEALAYVYDPRDLPYLEHMRERSIFGNPSEVKERLLALADQYDVDELVVVTITYDFAARVRSYELLAEAFGLRPDGSMTSAPAAGG
jgi:luciferase family oxidoreductase group 1